MLKNTKRAWYTAWALASLYGIWTVIISILSWAAPDAINKWIDYAQLAWILIYGFAIIFNGVVLVKFMQKQEKRIPKLQVTIDKTIRLSATLTVLYISIIAIIIGFAVSGIPETSDYYYFQKFFIFLVEVFQVIIVMFALGGERPINYIFFRPVNESISGISTTKNTGEKASFSSHVTHAPHDVTMTTFSVAVDRDLDETGSSRVDEPSATIPSKSTDIESGFGQSSTIDLLQSANQQNNQLDSSTAQEEQSTSSE